MKNLKIRIWDRLNKKMITDNPITITVGETVSAWAKNPDGTDYHLVNGETADFLQFTGLNDANNKEIFEGDILKITEANLSRVGGLEVVEWKQEKSGFFPFAGYYLGGQPFLVVNPSVIIGNIYENPELYSNE